MSTPPSKRVLRVAISRATDVAGWVSWTAAGLWWDLRTGMDTTRHVSARELRLDTSRGNLPYEPAGVRTLNHLFEHISISPRDVLLDLGCGKGRVVFWAAAHYPFARVLGVEITPELHAISLRNLSRYRERVRGAPVELICADAATFAIPTDVTLIFLNNPFVGEVFDHVLDNVVTSAARRPRLMRVLAIGTYMRERYLARGFEVRQIGPSTFEYSLQPVKPPDRTAPSASAGV